MSRDLGPLTRRDAAALMPVIADCCRVKGAIVAGDEREAGGRRVLNFGHTVGHALEAGTKYRRLLHGESVAYGMLGGLRDRRRRAARWRQRTATRLPRPSRNSAPCRR